MKVLQDVDFWFGGELVPSQLKGQLRGVNNAFCLNMEAIDGVTYRSPISKIVTKVDMIDASVVSPL